MELRNPAGVRPWQHVLEPLRGYLVYAEALAARRDLPAALNFGPAGHQAVTVAEVLDHAAATWARLVGDPPTPSSTVPPEARYHETAELTLDSAAAAEALGWVSLLAWQRSVDLSLEWYAGEQAGRPASELVDEQLHAYTAMIGETP